MGDRLRYWFFRLTSALRWYLGASTRYDVHSPFLTGFVREVYRDDRVYYAFSRIAEIRAYWRQQRQTVGLMQLGAPSRTTTARQRTAASLVSTNAIDDRCGRFLFRLTLWLRPERIVELGTNAGISTLYLHLADTRTPLLTVEGNGEVAALARTTFTRAAATAEVRSFTATFTDWLSRDLPTEPARVLAFLDGDHRYGPTLDYVQRLLDTATDESIIVVADIHWSPGMERAWAELRQHPRVTASVDVYHFGLLFLRPELRGPHLSLIRTRFKPWRIGFF
ncbi:O-methyltransferase [Neolewinella litorea]|nr:class I SAM-dependent methyltransferase [Neolewinella litorea]